MCVVLTISVLGGSEFGVYMGAPSAGQGKHCTDGKIYMFYVCSLFDCVQIQRLDHLRGMAHKSHIEPVWLLLNLGVTT